MSTLDPHVVALHLADLHLNGPEPWPADEPFPVVAHAVTHRDGVLLFDTGLGRGNEEIDRMFSPEQHPIDEALAAHGIEMADVTGVANCHLHVDHAGQNRLFAGRPIFVQRREWTMVHKPDYTIAEWVDAPALSYEVLDGEAGVAPGLRLVPTTGHSPGHQSLAVETSAGRVVIAGQAVLTVEEWEGTADREHSGEPTDDEGRRVAYASSIAELRALAPVRVHFVHDPGVWDRHA